MTVEFEDGTTMDIKATIFAVTKVINTVDDLIALGVGGRAGAGTRANSDVKGNDVIGYFLLGDDIDCGGMYASTVQNVNFEDVRFNGNTNQGGFWGNYMALFAHVTQANSKFTNINIQISAMDIRRDNYQFDDGLLVSGMKNAMFKNIVIDASGLDIECALGNGLVENVHVKYAAGDYTFGGHGYNSTFIGPDNPRGMTTYMTVRDCFIDGTDVTASKAIAWFSMDAFTEDMDNVLVTVKKLVLIVLSSNMKAYM